MVIGMEPYASRQVDVKMVGVDEWLVRVRAIPEGMLIHERPHRAVLVDKLRKSGY